MGTWDVGLFSNDTACDVKDTYMHFMEQLYDTEDAYKKTIIEYKDIMGTEEEPLFWYALADTQWNIGRLMPEVKNMALKFIKQKGATSLWGDASPKNAEWEKTLQKLKKKIESPLPQKKKFKKKKEFIHNPWNVGDIYAYQLHTEKAKQHDLFGKYILFQKIGDVEYYKNEYFSIVQIFNNIFNFVPTFAELTELHVLPLIYPPGINGMPNKTENYIPSFEWYMKATMLYEKECHYPKKHFIFIDNQNVSNFKYAGNDCKDFFWEKDGMEEWLIEYLVTWKKYLICSS